MAPEAVEYTLSEIGVLPAASLSDTDVRSLGVPMSAPGGAEAENAPSRGRSNDGQT
jgi:hypothetical protein